MKRFIAIWLPKWPIDCRPGRATTSENPFALTHDVKGGVRLYAVNGAAAALGLEEQMTLANARALAPALEVAIATPEKDAEKLHGLADWCGRFSPWCATDGAQGIRLEITGVAHLFGGEEAMLALMAAQFRKLRLLACLAASDRPLVAWAAARFSGRETCRVESGGETGFMAGLPVRALRLAARTVAGLEKVGLRRVGDLYGLPRAPLELRFGRQVLQRLDQLSGAEPEPISPLRPTAPFRTRLAWPEPIGLLSDIEAAAAELAAELCRQLESHGKGARRLELALYRSDGRVERIGIGTSVVSRDPRHMVRLLAPRLADVDAGFGLDVMIFSALEVAPCQGRQAGFGAMLAVAGTPHMPQDVSRSLGQLVDRLESRVGAPHVMRLVPFESHDPERAFTPVPGMAPTAETPWAARQPRPLRLLPVPERMKLIFDGPRPARYAWRREAGGVAMLEGPERISPEWWRLALETRDYFRLQSVTGRRYWIYAAYLRGEAAEGSARDWYMHGLFS